MIGDTVHGQGEMMMSVEDNKATARRFVENMVRDAIDGAMLAGDFTYWTAPTGPLSREIILSPGSKLGRLFTSTLRFQEDGITAEGDRVAIEARSEGELISGDWYRNIYHFLFVFAPDGRLRQVKEHMDTAHFATTLAPLMAPAD
jgi:ketosteroid isomerase-like protein